ncbi:spore germination protein KA [Paenibacillus castaneae]|uniref:spore germination protein n=1 Tax=Paenibacillus castaneae TaxID=474957 RepID=UPI000C9B926E|nr:spore germination protein [Paenibacillus castaneae]NIK78947.1 spore germination protein KA [Paenibacillus castaneae]
MGFFSQIFSNNRHVGKSAARKSRVAPIEKNVEAALQNNISYVDQALFHTEDLVSRPINYLSEQGCLLYLNSVCDPDKIQEVILKPLLKAQGVNPERDITANLVEKHTNLEPVIDLMIRGYAVLFLEGREECYAIQVVFLNNRAVVEPANEKSIQGAHDGFIESMQVNLQLVRKQINSRNLVVRQYTLGKMTKTDASIVYLNDLASPELVKEIERRITSINADNLMNGYLVLEYMEDKSLSPFPQILQTERPDRVAGNLLEGRVALLMEGTPAALIMPVSFFVFYQSPDDYNSRSLAGSFIRLLRLFSFFIAIMLPAYYIAVVSFHYEVIPMELFYQIKGSVEKIPYPPILEALFMELTIELLREAGMRLPAPIGQSIGIVGGLVIGDAVVRVGLVSYPMIIVVALTGIASFVVPSHEMSYSVRLLRFPMMIAAALLGFIGIVFSFTFMMVHLCKLESFGTPYFAPAAPMRLKDWKDAVVRFPFWKLNERPIDPQPQKLVQETRAKEERGDDRG